MQQVLDQNTGLIVEVKSLNLGLDLNGLDTISNLLTAQIIQCTRKHPSMCYYSALRPYNLTVNNLNPDGTEEIPFARPRSLRPQDFVSDMEVSVKDAKKELSTSNLNDEEKAFVFKKLLIKLRILFKTHFSHPNNIYYEPKDLADINSQIQQRIEEIAECYGIDLES